MSFEFVTVPSIPILEVNRKGVVRYVETKKKLTTRTKNHSESSFSIYINYRAEGKTRFKTLNVIMGEVFGEGAAAAIGLKEASIITGRKKIKQQWKKVVVKTNMRSCATCGKPTTNYRCSACWAEVRKVAA